ncbi:CAP domain-containing protein [Halanaerobacter jeridensis]|uniref:YkwD family protein n=1 Tax=Halanaerobacter jeridensis TaxID=706427 RepID=A0A939BRP1_9FIRM|nr:CAP domain-containing protein [Halanaerobacter jeridensis]MBM7556221.1 putative YkwD family protein [Halanaerobacter jeridensis]
MKKINFLLTTLLTLVMILTLVFTPSLAQNRNMKYRNHSLESQQNQSTLCTVKKGDCLWKIAKSHNFKLRKIINANPHFENPDLIYPGDKVYMPKKQDMQNESQMQKQNNMKQEKTDMSKEDTAPQTNNQMQTMKKEVVNLVNQERQKRGLKPYQHYSKLANVAQKKAEDMRDNNYFSHQSPTYGSPFEMLKEFNIQYSAAGENIARGQRTAEEVMNSWMNSPGHRKNILSEKYTHIGVGLAKNSQETNHWVQMFIRK